MKNLILIPLCIFSLNASDLKDRLEESFMVGCVQNSVNYTLGQSISYCLCQWQGIEKKYTDKQLFAIDTASVGSPMVKEMLKFTDSRANECVNVAFKYR